jgi:hypothetical protein
MPNRLRGGILLFLCLIMSAYPASAQTSTGASLSTPNIDAFPQITAYLDVHDSQGYFFNGLKSEQVRVLENGVPQQITQIQQIRPGVQVVVAINPGPSFGIRNNQAVSRYDNIKDTLKSWASSRLGSNVDDWSLIITNGPSISHVTKPKDWLAALETEQVDPRTAIPNIDTLFHAFTLATDPLIRPGMGRTVLFITPPPEGNADQTLESLSAQAKEQGISINIWMVSSSGAYSTQSIKQLIGVAEVTGGQFFTYTGEETLPEIEEYLNPLRSVYLLEYQSNIKSSGVHQLTVQVQIGSEQIETETQSFEIDLQPPVPAFVSPPISLFRKPAVDENTIEINQAQAAEAGNLKAITDNSLPIIVPQEQTIRVVFDFPDGRKRPLVQTSLSVDGVVVSQNLQPPFDQFTWPLDSYTVDGVHNIQVQAVDTLGLTGLSIEIPVQIIVEHPNQDPWAPIKKNLPIFSVLIALLAGGLAFLVLVTGRRLRPSSLRVSGIHRKKHDPITQRLPLRVESTSRGIPKWVNRLQFSRQPGTPKPLAYLSCVSGSDELSTSPPIPITTDETTIGTGVEKATLVLHDPSIEILHARLKRDVDGTFCLSDEGSIAGTWVNYSPISKDGTRIEHGDLIYIGRIGFRFLLCEPTQKRKPLVTPDQSPEEPSQDADL